MKTIVGMFDNLSEAHRAVDDLTKLGIPRSDVSVITPKKDARDATTDTSTTGDKTNAAEGAGIGAATGAVAGGAAGLLASLGLLAIPGIGWLFASGALAATLTGMGVGAAAGGLIGGLIGLGIPEEDAEQYEEGVRRGSTVVTAKINDNQTQSVLDVFQRHNAVDVDKRSQEWRQAGWQPKFASGLASGGTSTPRPQPTAASRRADDTQRIPVVEERLTVGKREVDRGGVRVYAHTTQEPVSQEVRLRQEKVRVERRAADRPATEADLNAFREGTVELHEKSEEPVVQKQARVTGEVVVRKDVEEKTETVRDTVRRTDVKVDRTEGQQSGTSGSKQGPACNT